MNTARAVMAVAQRVIHAAVDPNDPVPALWENYPEIGGRDWAEVLVTIQHLTPDSAQYDVAYTYLTSRAMS